MFIPAHTAKSRIFFFIAASLIPLAAMILGIYLLINHTIINIAFLISFILLPTGTMYLLKRTILSFRPSFFDALGAILSLAGFAVLFLISLAGKFEALEKHTGDQIPEHYAEVKTDFPSMPNLADTNAALKQEHYKYQAAQFFFSWNADILICKYDDTDYSAQKQRMETTYSFQNEPMNAGGTLCEPSTQIDGYFFRFVSPNSDYAGELNYPKRLILIATNDQTNEIVYIAFDDVDIDFIDDPNNFIVDHCGWRHIR